MIHELKILPEYFDAVCLREKTFELRKNDRGFKVGDYLHLKEWDGEKYTGREVTRYVNYILYDWTGGLQDGWCIMNLKISHLKATLDQTDVNFEPHPAEEVMHAIDMAIEALGKDTNVPSLSEGSC